MTNRELKIYAIAGMLIRLQSEQDKLKNTTDESRRQQIQNRIDIIKEHYAETLNELQNKNPLE